MSEKVGDIVPIRNPYTCYYLFRYKCDRIELGSDAILGLFFQITVVEEVVFAVLKII